jgi:hypothetical protein
MSAWSVILSSIFLLTQAQAGEINKTLRETHGNVEGLSHHLSDALNHLSKGVGERPRASEQDPTVKMIVKALHELKSDPSSPAMESFESLKRQEAASRKELMEIVNEWIKNDAKEESEKSLAVERALIKERELVREKTKLIQEKIKAQIDEVMARKGYFPKWPGSTTYEKDGSLLSVRFDSGDILVNPIKPLPPVGN